MLLPGLLSNSNARDFHIEGGYHEVFVGVLNSLRRWGDDILLALVVLDIISANNLVRDRNKVVKRVV